MAHVRVLGERGLRHHLLDKRNAVTFVLCRVLVGLVHLVVPEAEVVLAQILGVDEEPVFGLLGAPHPVVRERLLHRLALLVDLARERHRRRPRVPPGHRAGLAALGEELAHEAEPRVGLALGMVASDFPFDQDVEHALLCGRTRVRRPVPDYPLHSSASFGASAPGLGTSFDQQSAFRSPSFRRLSHFFHLRT